MYTKIIDNCMIDKVSICSICLNEIIESQKSRYKCSHCSNTFHTVCMNEWMNIKEICPLCRSDLNDVDTMFFRIKNKCILDRSYYQLIPQRTIGIDNYLENISYTFGFWFYSVIIIFIIILHILLLHL